MNKYLLLILMALVGCDQTPSNPPSPPKQNFEQTQSVSVPPQNAPNAQYYAPPVQQSSSAVDTMANAAIAGASAGAAGALAHNMMNRALAPKQPQERIIHVYKPPVYRPPVYRPTLPPRPAYRPSYRPAPRTQSIYRGRR